MIRAYSAVLHRFTANGRRFTAERVSQDKHRYPQQTAAMNRRIARPGSPVASLMFYALLVLMLLLPLAVVVVHNEPASATGGQFAMHYRSQPAASGFINRTVSEAQLIEAIAFAEDLVGKMKTLESSIAHSRIRLDRNSTSFALLLDSLPDERAKAQDRQAQIVLKASVQLLNRYCFGHQGQSAAECARDIETVPLPKSSPTAAAICSANNRSDEQQPATYRRLLDAAYVDGLQRMHHAHSRPLPKTISDQLYASIHDRRPDDGPEDAALNNAVVQWSQFVEHDLAKTVFRTMDDNRPIECCDADYRDAPPRYRHPDCAQLTVESSAYANVRCLNYVRSALGPNGKCTFGAAQQLNQATSKLDLSQLYGQSAAVRSAVRSHRSGELLANGDGGRSPGETLPKVTGDGRQCAWHRHRASNGSGDSHECYASGDGRCNANPYVTPMYTMFLRSHNRLARQIERIRPNWTDEQVFRKTRRINTHVYQSLVYGEWLPVVIGRAAADQINAINETQLTDADGGSATSNEWATSAARFYYSMMPGSLRLDGESETLVSRTATPLGPKALDIQHEFYRPRNLHGGRTLERIMSAVLRQPAMAMDAFYVDDVSRYMFRTSAEQELGTDVLALDIQRGRDHGLAGYTQYVELCTGRAPIGDWSELADLISEENLARLRTIYANVQHVDLIAGAVAETPLANATVGPTYACLFREQFGRTRRAEYRSKDVIYETVLNERYGGANFLCENSELQYVPQNIFRVPSSANPLVECAALQKLCDILGNYC